jgi:fido (protein-threonine AMPylation protein)
MESSYRVIGSEGTPQTRRDGWEIGFGLQSADGLQPSGYAKEIAQENISGKLDYKAVSESLAQYHAANPSQHQHEEADIVSAKISRLLQDPSFVFSPASLKAIHRFLFDGLYPQEWVGEWRTENIAKAEPALHGESVVYASSFMIEETLTYDFDQEKARRPRYVSMPRERTAEQVFDFISGVWQIHPFREGNTRTSAVFAIQYLRALGFTVDNAPFSENGQYFRDALVLANAPDDYQDKAPLQAFIDAALFHPDRELVSLRAD